MLDISGYLQSEIPHILHLIGLYWKKVLLRNLEYHLATGSPNLRNDPELLFRIAVDLNIHALQVRSKPNTVKSLELTYLFFSAIA